MAARELHHKEIVARLAQQHRENNERMDQMMTLRMNLESKGQSQSGAS